MCKYIVIVVMLFSLPALANDAIEIRQADRLASTLLNDTSIPLNESTSVLFDPHTLISGDHEQVLPDYCLLSADAVLNGNLLLLSPRNILCVTDQQKVLESELSGFATVNGVAAVPFDCARTTASGCAEVRLQAGFSVDFQLTEPTTLRIQR
ncbi:hypothetical protein NFC81_12555 [Salinispirillum sp. LH 10-3-1]|uniref:Organic solvent tolerance-like N-terminal domain-containing protein n=1 Tax=Salinispirillum sp. LH 10-3-1 TaxID=2952525 RepID=A0AB38YDU6_9GAMM